MKRMLLSVSLLLASCANAPVDPEPKDPPQVLSPMQCLRGCEFAMTECLGEEQEGIQTNNPGDCADTYQACQDHCRGKR